jgi:hypothetical protein
MKVNLNSGLPSMNVCGEEEKVRNTHACSLSSPHRHGETRRRVRALENAREWSVEILPKAFQAHNFLLQFIFAICLIHFQSRN